MHRLYYGELPLPVLFQRRADFLLQIKSKLFQAGSCCLYTHTVEKRSYSLMTPHIVYGADKVFSDTESGFLPFANSDVSENSEPK